MSLYKNRVRSASMTADRGFLRSGTRYAARNNPYYSSVAELLSHHKRLLLPEPAITTRAARILGVKSGSLLQTTARFTLNSSVIRPTLRSIFFDLFREHSESGSSGFEVVTTFNAVLTNSTETTFSLFYGHDHRASNIAGAAPELKYGDTVIVRSLLDLDLLQTAVDPQELVRANRHAFQDSNVHVHSFVNIVFLIYRFVDL